MTKKELKERLDALGSEPLDLSSHVLYLAQTLDIVTAYLLAHKIAPR